MSGQVLLPSESSRWYYADGRCADEVPSVDGKKMVATNKNHAAKLHLYPGQSQIKGRKASPMLDRWKLENALRVALANPINPGEQPDDWIRRIDGIAREMGTVAQDRGKAVHAAVEEFLINKTIPDDPVMQNAVAGLQRFMEIRGVKTIHAEQVFVDTVHGFAGRMDIHATECADGHPFIADVKVRTKGWSVDNSLPYLEEGVQLGCYWLGSGADPSTEIISILIDGITGENKWYRWGDQWAQQRKPSRTKEVLAKMFMYDLEEFFLYIEYDPRKAQVELSKVQL